MADESGGDFGGGSVNWTIRYPANTFMGITHGGSVSHSNGTPNPNKKRTSGRDENSGATQFWIELRNKKPNGGGAMYSGTTLQQQLQAALDALQTNPEKVTITLPIVPGVADQIRVLWERHPPHAIGGSAQQSAPVSGDDQRGT